MKMRGEERVEEVGEGNKIKGKRNELVSESFTEAWNFKAQAFECISKI